MSTFAEAIAKLDASRPVLLSSDASKLIHDEAASRRDVILVWKTDDLNGVVADRHGFSVFVEGHRQRHIIEQVHSAPLTNFQRALTI